MTDRKLQLTLGDDGASADAEVLHDRILDAEPVWHITELKAGPDLDGCLPNDEACGCSDHLHFSDQMLFSASTLELASVRWTVPERNMDPGEAEHWRLLPVRSGLPRLHSRSTFRLSSAAKRRYIAVEDSLVGLFAGISHNVDAYRLRFATDLSLLVAAGTQVGWVLENASFHLRSPITELAPNAAVASNEQGRTMLQELLDFIDVEFVAAVQRGDPEARHYLTSAVERAETSGTDGVAMVLAEWTRDMVEWFVG